MGEVCDLALELSGESVVGIILSGGWPLRRRMLARRAITAWGHDVLVAGAEQWLPDGAAIAAADLAGKPVIAHSGHELGHLDDVEFDPASGMLTAVGLSAGLVADLLHGKSRITASNLRMGEAVLWVEPAATDEGRGSDIELS